MRRFTGVRLSDRLPDESTIRSFRHLLARHQLGEKLFNEINKYLQSQGLVLREGSIATTSANVHDITQADKQLHEKEECVWGMRAIGGLRSERNTKIAISMGLEPAPLYGYCPASRYTSLTGQEQ